MLTYSVTKQINIFPPETLHQVRLITIPRSNRTNRRMVDGNAWRLHWKTLV